MEAIKVEKTIDSEILRIPELKRFMGKKVEIILLEVPLTDDQKQQPDISRFLSAAKRIDIDENAVRRLREESLI